MMNKVSTDVLRPILSDWLLVEDLAYFDSALCNFEQRRRFLAMISHDNFALDTPPQRSQRGFYGWIIHRKIALMRVHCSWIDMEKAVLMAYLSRIKSIYHLSCSSISELGNEAGSILSKVEKLSLSRPNMENSEFVDILKKCDTKLHSLEFSFCNLLTNEICRAIVEHCPQITSINYGHCDLITEKSMNIFCNGLPNLTSLTVGKLPLYNPNQIMIEDTACSKVVSFDFSDMDCIMDGSCFDDIAAKQMFNVVRNHCKRITLSSTGFINPGTRTDLTVFCIAETCPSLTYVDINNCSEITDAGMIALFENCPHLTNLSFGSKHITDESLFSLAKHCKNLARLNMDGAKFVTDSGVIPVVQRNPNITFLALNYCDLLTDWSVLTIAKCCKFLKMLSLLCCTKVTDHAWLKVIERHGQYLRYLGVAQTKMTDTSLLALLVGCEKLVLTGGVISCDKSHCTYSSIQYAHIMSRRRNKRSCSSGCDGLFGGKLQYAQSLCIMARNNPGLIVLVLRDVVDLTDDILCCLLEHCPLIEDLTIWNCGDKISGVSLTRLAARCHNLQYLRANKMVGVIDDAVIALVTNRPQFRELHLSHCLQLTDIAVMAVAESCPALRVLDVSGSVLLSDASIVEVVKKCKLLHELHISECPLITPAVLTCINANQHGGNLRDVSVVKCPKLSMQYLLRFAFGNSTLKTFRCSNSDGKVMMVNCRHK